MSVEDEEQVAGRRVPVEATELEAVDRRERRCVDGVVPVGRDLAVLEHAATVAHHVEAVHLHVLQQLEVVRGPAHRDARAGAALGESTVLEEDPLELPEDDLQHVRPRR
jgi:hypothetical protein